MLINFSSFRKFESDPRGLTLERRNAFRVHCEEIARLTMFADIRSGSEIKAIMAFEGFAIRIITATPIQCQCGKMAAMFVNRNGVTLCVDCDAQRLRENDQRSRLIA